MSQDQLQNEQFASDGVHGRGKQKKRVLLSAIKNCNPITDLISSVHTSRKIGYITSASDDSVSFFLNEITLPPIFHSSSSF